MKYFPDGSLVRPVPSGTASRDHATAAVAETDVYGYLLGTVTPEGHVSFVFNQIKMDDISEEIRARFGTDLVNRCFVENKSDYVPEGASCESK